MTLTSDQIRALPKVALHDHLDGGVRSQTVIDHARDVGHTLPSYDADNLADWFFTAADSGNLVSYLSTFTHTVAAMQTREHIARVAHEFVLDQAADGVIYAEARWAPEQHTERGLTEAEAVEAVRDGLASGMAEVAASGGSIVAQQILTSMRHGGPTTRIAELCVAYRDQGVCGFDIAGAEDGFPPARFVDAFAYLRAHNAYYTIHAGEAFGVPSIQQAVECGALRLGHGVRLIDDIEVTQDGYRLGTLASFIKNQRIALEVCPTSNLQTGIAPDLAHHPIRILNDLNFRVAVSCDNRLQSRTTLTAEFTALHEQLGWGLADIQRSTINATKAAFYPYDERRRLIEEVIRPGYETASA